MSCTVELILNKAK